MTYRERREARVERLRGWAEGREAKADALHARNEPYRGDIAFNTQPGHIPERARAVRRAEQAWEHSAMAERHSDRADSIERAAEHAIYSDDKDAVERLRERIASLEGERDRIKAYNASCRKGQRDVTLLDEKQQQELVTVARVASYSLGKNGAYPGYALTNLSGNINRQKKRLVALGG